MVGNDVVVTGMGLCTGLASELSLFWERLIQGCSCIKWDESLDLPTARIANIKGDNRIQPILDIALNRALKHASIDLEHLNGTRLASTLSSSKGAFPKYLLGLSKNWSSGLIQIPAINLSSACATGLQTIEWGARWIRANHADIVVAGGVDSVLNQFWINGYRSLGILADSCENKEAQFVLKPFSKNRTGTVLGEGCGVVILESWEHARKRRVPILAKIESYYNGSDAYHISNLNPSGCGVSSAIKLLLKRAGMNPGDIDYINLHGNGTHSNDLAETKGLKDAFGPRIYSVATSSTKAATGHMIGACGAVEFIVTVMSVLNNIVPPTLNLDEQDEFCDLDYTPFYARNRHIENAITLSYGLGGHISALLVSKPR